MPRQDSNPPPVNSKSDAPPTAPPRHLLRWVTILWESFRPTKPGNLFMTLIGSTAVITTFTVRREAACYVCAVLRTGSSVSHCLTFLAVQCYLGFCSKSGTLTEWLAFANVCDSCRLSSVNDNRQATRQYNVNIQRLIKIWCQLDLGNRADTERG